MTTRTRTAKKPAAKKAADKRPLIHFIGLGGTISGGANGRLTIMDNLEHIKALQKTVGSAPNLHDFIRVKAEHPHVGGSGSLGAKMWLELARKGNEYLSRPDVSGIVYTHGTSTMEELTYWLHLTVRSKKPIVMTGAMRAPRFLGTDADNSLLNAATVVAAPESWGRGALLVLNNEIHGARDVTKQNGYSRQTFGNRELGILGYAAEETFYARGLTHQPSYYRYPSRKHTYQSEFDVSKLKDLPSVYIVDSYEGCDGLFVEAAVKAGAKGIVVNGMGGGAPAGEAQRNALEAAAKKGVAVVYTTRTGAGLVVRSQDLIDKRIITGDNLNCYHARVLLMLALTKTKDPNGIQKMFDTY